MSASLLRAASVGVDQFGKKNFPVSRFSLEDPLWMIEITPVLHHSNGGIQINASTEVVTTREDGTSSIILGLYAAGECTGGTSLNLSPQKGCS
jgi:succinate dehydrogenase/fumarate reductase flavoprotein subunit